MKQFSLFFLAVTSLERFISRFIIIIIILAFCNGRLTPIFTYKASHNKWPKVYGFIVHLLCSSPSPMSISISISYKNLHLPIFLHSFSPVQFLEQFPSPSATFFPSPNPVSTNLIRNLKPSSIYLVRKRKRYGRWS